MLIAICLTLIILSLLSFSIISEAKVNLDFYGDDNSISFFLFGFKVIKINIYLVKNVNEPIKLELKNKDKIIAEIDASDINRNMASSLRKALPNPFYNLDIVEIEVNAQYGGDNAFSTVMTSLILENLFYGALLYILSTQKVRAKADVMPCFNRKSLNLKASSIFSITLADIIYGILFSKKGDKKNDS